MVTILFVANSAKYGYQSLSFDGPTIESCFETLTFLVAQGWELIHVVLVDDENCTTLPVEAFDGISMTMPLNELNLELKEILV
ncbi:hypothetical protein GCM10028805_47040 [Spirosoma harenae]